MIDQYLPKKIIINKKRDKKSPIQFNPIQTIIYSIIEKKRENMTI